MTESLETRSYAAGFDGQAERIGFRGVHVRAYSRKSWRIRGRS